MWNSMSISRKKKSEAKFNLKSIEIPKNCLYFLYWRSAKNIIFGKVAHISYSKSIRLPHTWLNTRRKKSNSVEIIISNTPSHTLSTHARPTRFTQQQLNDRKLCVLNQQVFFRRLYGVTLEYIKRERIDWKFAVFSLFFKWHKVPFQAIFK